ncbi:tripartite tricarboxylate transporter substrate binding protein [Orrella sp. JC864]|uniref:Bug family tripartite tricarboxylate transporter substrate binding protein n=1 Tax=Orrella sp. JC864 TaxID=3120298 RepID=UPI00300A6EAB
MKTWIAKAMAGALGAACMLAATGPAAAQDAYPERPLRLIVPWAVGGSTDMLGRLLAERMGRELGQAIVVENRPGATGTIGFSQVARAPADGYTLLLGTNSTFAIAPHFYPDLNYDVLRDFASVGMIGVNQQVLCVTADSPLQSLDTLLERARRQPGEVTYASSGVGGSSHLATELLMARLDFDMLHVPYKGGAPALQAIMGKQVDIGFVDISLAEPLIKGGKLRALGTSGTNRAPTLPDVPTLAEAGARDFSSLTTFSLLVPAGVPAPVVSRVNAALNTALTDPAVIDRLGAMGYELTPGDAQAYVEHARAENAKWGELITERKITLTQ